MAELPWSTEPNAAFDRDAMNALGATLLPNSQNPKRVVIAGDCPRCKHPMIYSRQLGSLIFGLEMEDRVMDALTERGADFSSGEQEFTVSCSCETDHPETPDGSSGCGAPFQVRIAWP